MSSKDKKKRTTNAVFHKVCRHLIKFSFNIVGCIETYIIHKSFKPPELKMLKFPFGTPNGNFNIFSFQKINMFFTHANSILWLLNSTSDLFFQFWGIREIKLPQIYFIWLSGWKLKMGLLISEIKFPQKLIL